MSHLHIFKYLPLGLLLLRRRCLVGAGTSPSTGFRALIALALPLPPPLKRIYSPRIAWHIASMVSHSAITCSSWAGVKVGLHSFQAVDILASSSSLALSK